MPECKLCGKNGEDLTLLSASHKDLGQVMVCEECWKKLWNKNRYGMRHYRLRRHMPKLQIKKSSGRAKPVSSAPFFDSLEQVHALETIVYSCRK